MLVVVVVWLVSAQDKIEVPIPIPNHKDKHKEHGFGRRDAPPVPGHPPLVLVERQGDVLPLRHLHDGTALGLVGREPRGRLLLRAGTQRKGVGQRLLLGRIKLR